MLRNDSQLHRRHDIFEDALLVILPTGTNRMQPLQDPTYVILMPTSAGKLCPADQRHKPRNKLDAKCSPGGRSTSDR